MAKRGKRFRAFTAFAVMLGLVSAPGCLTAGYVKSMKPEEPAPVLAAPVLLPLCLAGDVAFDATAAALLVGLLPIEIPLFIALAPGFKGLAAGGLAH